MVLPFPLKLFSLTDVVLPSTLGACSFKGQAPGGYNFRPIECLGSVNVEVGAHDGS